MERFTLLFFGKINFSNNKYKSDEEFKNIIRILVEFKRNNSRKPSNKDLGMFGVNCSIRRGEWIAYGIKLGNLFKIIHYSILC